MRKVEAGFEFRKIDWLVRGPPAKAPLGPLAPKTRGEGLYPAPTPVEPKERLPTLERMGPPQPRLPAKASVAMHDIPIAIVAKEIAIRLDMAFSSFLGVACKSQKPTEPGIPKSTDVRMVKAN
jgi:hypothetical protein